MNLSDVIFNIKLDLGLLAISTPIKDLDQTMVKIINEMTLPSFSARCPLNQHVQIDIRNLEKIDKGNDYETFVLPDFKTKKILYLYEINYIDTHVSGIGYYGGGMPIMMGNIIHQTMLSNATNNVLSQMMPKITFDFKAPRTCRIYNCYNSSELDFHIGFSHPSVESIPETARDSFLDLAKLDVKAKLYPTMKYYSSVNTAHGNIDLKLDNWAEAESQRAELLRQWDDDYHTDMPCMFWY